MKALQRFFLRQEGQDLAEYCLIAAAAALIAGALLAYFSGGMRSVWGEANQTIGSAATAPASRPSSSNTGSVR